MRIRIHSSTLFAGALCCCIFYLGKPSVSKEISKTFGGARSGETERDTHVLVTPFSAHYYDDHNGDE